MRSKWLPRTPRSLLSSSAVNIAQAQATVFNFANMLHLKRIHLSESIHLYLKNIIFPQVPADSLKDIEANLPEPVTLWQKLVPLALIFFCASFNLTILQNLRDAIMVTAAGAETLPFLASLGVLPASLAFLSLYGRLVERLPSTM